MIDQDIMVYGLGVIAGSGILGTVIATTLAFDWRSKATKSQSEATAAKREARLSHAISESWQKSYEVAASDVLSLTDQLRVANGLANPEPKLIRIPKGQPGAGRFIPNPKLKAELTA